MRLMASPNFDTTSVNVQGSLIDYLYQSRKLGSVRFVVVGSGAILETVGSYDNLRFADTIKGNLATVSTEHPNFECHIRLNEIKQIQMVELSRNEKLMYISRFLDANGTTVLSSILHGEECIREWKALKSAFISSGEESFTPTFFTK